MREWVARSYQCVQKSVMVFIFQVYSSPFPSFDQLHVIDVRRTGRRGSRELNVILILYPGLNHC